MRNFQHGHLRGYALLTPGAALALGWWCVALGCTVYEPALLDGERPVAGSGGSGTSGSASGGMGDEPEGGNASGGKGATTSAGAGAEPTAGAGAVSGGTGGSAGSAAGDTSGAGSAGTGGGGTPPAGDADPVDDMEDGDAQISVSAGRNGYWYVGNDGTAGGTQEPPSNAFEMFEVTAGQRPNSAFVARMKVDGFKSWGSVIGFNFSEQLGKVLAYDASAYCGVSFWGKAAAATALRFRVPDGNTHPAGAVCVDAGPPGMACYDYFSAAASFTTEWQQFEVLFAELVQVGTGYHPMDGKLKVDELFGLEWAIAGTDKAHEIWIDDVQLLRCP